MEQINTSFGNFDRIDILETPEGIVLNAEFKNNGLCLNYAVLCARQNDNVEIIEGLVLVIPKDKEKFTSGVIIHAWNIQNDIYFDETKNKVWGDDYEKLLYFPIIKNSEVKYGEETISFDDRILIIQKEIQKEIEIYKNLKEENE